MKENKSYYTEQNLITTIEDNGYTELEFANGEWIRVKTPELAYIDGISEDEVNEVLFLMINNEVGV